MSDAEVDAQRIARQRALGISATPVNPVPLSETKPFDDIEATLSTVPTPAPRAIPTVEPAEALITKKTAPQSQTLVIPRRGSSIVTGVLVALALCTISASAYFLMRPPVVYSISIPNGTSTSTPITYGMMPALADPDYYLRVRTQFIVSKASFIDADLASMKLTVYQKGEVALEVPILAKGKPGSWWETPVGIYKIETKEKNHFSSFGQVNMPWSLDFDGNFFIHGWPTHPDGTPVSTSYSGGCIRLDTEDAMKVFALAEVGMPVVVYKASDTHDSYQYNVRGPYLGASEYLAADITNGTILFSNNATSVVPIASVTKLITALVVIEHFNLDKMITITPDMITKTTKQRLKSGESVSVHDLLILMLTESSNEAAETFARAFGRDQFIKLMDQKAISIGLHNTSFTDPAGLDPTDTSSAEDLFTLLKYIYENRRFIFDISRSALEHDAYGDVVFKNLENFNFIPGATNPFIGGKIGNTDEARETYAGVFMFSAGDESRPIALIALGSEDVQKDIATLLRSVNTTYGPLR